MNVTTLTMDPAAAAEKLEEYRGRRAGHHDPELDRAQLAYEQLSKGTPLIALSTAIANCPRDARRRPLLAIARADRRQVSYRAVTWQRRGHEYDSGAQRGPGGRELSIFVPVADPRVELASDVGFALVPMVPPAVRGRRVLERHFILWEVEAWADRRISALADRDPYLLKRIADDLFAVVGEWDLTDVERAVMLGRRDQ